MIERVLVKNKFFKGKAILLFGARQVGKTTMVEAMLKQESKAVLHLSGDEPDIREIFKNITSTQINNYVGNHNILFIDETQRIQNIGALWENYLISERIKHKRYLNKKTEFYFWRTTQQQEIDLIEVEGDKMTAIEFKWNTNLKAKISKTFTKAYPTANLSLINPKNYEEFLL